MATFWNAISAQWLQRKSQTWLEAPASRWVPTILPSVPAVCTFHPPLARGICKILHLWLSMAFWQWFWLQITPVLSSSTIVQTVATSLWSPRTTLVECSLTSHPLSKMTTLWTTSINKYWRILKEIRDPPWKSFISQTSTSTLNTLQVQTKIATTFFVAEPSTVSQKRKRNRLESWDPMDVTFH